MTINQRKPIVGEINNAYGLPSEFYIDEHEFKREIETVFNPNWCCIGFGHDVPNPGDVMPIEFAGIPLIISRDREFNIHVFYNVCRHRGMKLVEKATTIVGVIRCPYHSWCYKLNGDLYATPHVGGTGHNKHKAIDKSKHGLIEIKSSVWLDMIFVNFSGTAPEFEDYAQPLMQRWHEFKDQPIFHHKSDSSFSLTVNCNWKLAVENYCESYHLPWVHPSLNNYSRLQDHYNIVEDGKHSGQGTLVYDPRLGDGSQKFENFSNLSDKWKKAAEYIALYPNVLIGVHKDHLFVIQLNPIDVNKTVERINIYYASEQMIDSSFDDLRAKNTAMWKVVFAEDVFVVEGMQKGRHATGFDGGKFSPAMDIATHCFHDWVAKQYSKENNKQTNGK